MYKKKNTINNGIRILTYFFLLLILVSCGGDDGARGAAGPEGPAGEPGPPGPSGPPGQDIGTIEADELDFIITGVTGGATPTISFSVTNEKGEAFSGIGDSDLRFNIAKLIPVINGEPAHWQNYIVGTRNGGMSASQERNGSGSTWGTFINNQDGTYTYTFGTDLSAVDCPEPCSDLDGNPLDLSYQAAYTHRISIQQGNRDLPLVNKVYDYVPDGSDVTFTREITKTETCNECHDRIAVHGTRFETQLCVTCHNPGTWNGTDVYTADLGPMLHRIHRGANLPSVQAGGSVVIAGHDYSDVHFPQDIRNCTKCHDGEDEDTPEGNAWMTPSLQACGACHDDIDFSKDGSVEEGGHSGGVVTDNSECITCHAPDRIAGGVDQSHYIPGKLERGLFQFNILAICGTDATAGPTCTPSSNPSLTFSVTDPTGATDHGYGNAYNVRADGPDPEFNASGSSLNALVAWSTSEYTNTGGSGARPSRADSVNLRTSAAVTDNGDGTFSLDGAAAGLTIPAEATGSGTIGLEGHPVAADREGNYTVRVPVNSEVAYFAITDAAPIPRRQVVDVPTKCDRCHDMLNLHGNNRNNNGQLCVVCHNPTGTDISRRPSDAVTGLPDTVSTIDGKQEETIDFKVLIHAIHAGAQTTYDGKEAHGFREKGLVVYGYGGSAHDYSHVRFPGVLSKCETCHLPDTYTLDDRSEDGGANWMMPSLAGIVGSTIHSHPNAAADGSDFNIMLADHSDDWKTSPTVSVCAACHDSALAQQHMMDNNGIFGGAGSEQDYQETSLESCAVCHGPGRIADVKFVHDAAFDAFWSTVIPE